MKFKVGKYEFEGTPEEILAFWIGYEMKDKIKNIAEDNFNDLKED